MGGILARHLAKLGHHVSIANSRGPESLTALAAEIGATPVSVVDAAKTGEIVILAIPTKAAADLPRGLFANVPSSVIVIDIGNYHPELRDGRIDAIDRGMLDSQWVAQQIGRPVIKAFNNILAESLLEKGVPRGTTGRIALSVAGDSLDAKETVLRLVDVLALTLSTVVIWTTPGGSSLEHRLIAGILKPLLSGALSPKLIGAGSPNTAPNRRLG
jgi:predicted dinucleotide-binding enzyme